MERQDETFNRVNDMKIEYINIDNLKKYNNNAKEHSDEQIAGIAKSIERFGFRQPIVIDSGYTIVIGHGRWLAAKKLCLKEVPVTVIDDLGEDEINALRLIDNRLNESAWDFSALEEELATITGIDMTDFGFRPITEEEIEYATRRPEMHKESQYENKSYEDARGRDDGLESQPRYYTQNQTLEATTAYRGRWDETDNNERLIGERSLTDVDGGREYKYRCPRCKHLFN